MTTADSLVNFAEAGNQQRFRCRDNRMYQGWIMEITDDSLLISTGAGESGQDHWVRLQDMDPDSLAYWDTAAQAWLPFKMT